jgi:hypothetical protein
MSTPQLNFITAACNQVKFDFGVRNFCFEVFLMDLMMDICCGVSTKGENGQENPLTIFARISFYSISNRNGKVRNRIRSVKSDPSKMDKSEQKCPGINRKTII